MVWYAAAHKTSVAYEQNAVNQHSKIILLLPAGGYGNESTHLMLAIVCKKICTHNWDPHCINALREKERRGWCRNKRH